jgi:hypothetical protein
MSSEEVTFAMKLDSNVAQTATSDASALEQLKEALTADIERLREMQKAYRNLKGSASANSETLKSLKDQITASKASISSSTEKLVGMKGAFDKLPKPIVASQGALNRMMLGARDAKSPMQELTEKLGGMRTLLGGGVIAVGLVAIAAGMTAVATAAGVATVALLGYAIAAADARRSDTLRLEGLSKHRNYWLEMVTGQRRAADSASFLQTTIDRVAAASPLARDRISEMTGELYRAGLRSGNLQAALEGLVIVESTQGQEAAAAFKARALGAALYGTSIKKLSDDVKARLGGIAKSQMLSLDVQQRKLRENLQLLFKDVKIEGFLKALNSLTELFSQSTASGRALKAIVDTLLSPLIGSLEFLAPLAKRFFQGFVIAALQMTIVILKVRNTLRDIFKGSKFFENMDLSKMALYAGMAAFGAVATVVLVTAAAFGTLAAMAGVVTYAIYQVGKPFAWAIAQGAKLIAWVDGVKWTALGTTITSGIAAGIRAGVGAVIDAMRNMGSDAIKAFKQKLGIKSPSRVAFAAALEVPRGARLALDAGRPQVQAAAQRMASAAEEGMRAGGMAPQEARRSFTVPAAAPAPRAATASAAAPSRVINFTGPINVQSDSKDPDVLKRSLREALSEIIEQEGVMLGVL